MAFNPSEHLMKIGYKDKAQDYLEVKWRLVWFRDLCPEGTIETEMVMLDLDRPTQDEQSVWNNEKRKMEKVVKEANGFVIFKATVKDGKGGVAVGTKSEKAAAFPDFIEKCESGAVGRALAMLGFGTQFTGDELKEGHRIVDSPVAMSDDNQQRPNSNTTQQPPQPMTKPTPAPTSTAAAPLPKDLRVRCTALKISWSSAKVKVLGSDVPDDNLTPEQCNSLHVALAKREEAA